MQSGRAHVNSLDSPFFILHSALEWSATRDLHPEGSAILSRRGLLFPLKPVAVRWWARRELHPQGCQILSLDPLLFGLNHMPVNWCIRQDSHLQTLRSKRRMIIISPRMRKWSRWRDSHSRGAMRPAVYETAAVAAEPHRRNGGSPRCCPVLCGLRDRCIAAMLATRTRHEGGVEPPQPGL